MSIKDLIQRMIDAVASGETSSDGVKITQLMSGRAPNTLVDLYDAKVSCDGFDLAVRIVFSKGDVVIQNDFNEDFVGSVVDLFNKKCNVYYELIVATGSSHTEIDDFDIEQDSNIVDSHAMLFAHPLHDGWCTINWLCGDCYSCANGNDWGDVLEEVMTKPFESL